MKEFKKNAEESFRLIDGADKQLIPQKRASRCWRTSRKKEVKNQQHVYLG